MTDNIPIEIQMEIVKRLPVKALFRFRSVSKSWKSAIDSPQFIADYNACESRPHNLLIKYEDRPYPYRFINNHKYVCIVDDDMFPQNKFPTTVPVATSFEHLDDLRLIGSSQGLFCFFGQYRNSHSYWEMAFIWNPAIRKSIVIDVPVLLELFGSVLGFGVCPDTNEPMLVKIYKILPIHVEFFTLSYKEWRLFYSNLPHILMISQSHVAIGRFLYWQSTNFDQRSVVSFDMTSKEFVEINLPHSLASIGTKDLSISNLRESLAVLEHYKEAEKPVCGVWIMEHGVSKSFTKLYTVTTPNACLMKVLGFRKNGEVVLEAKKDTGHEPAVLEVYEPRSEVIKDVGIYGEQCWFFLSPYKETLLLLDQVDNQHFKIKNGA